MARKGWKCLLSHLAIPTNMPVGKRFRRLTIVSPSNDSIYRQMPYGFTFENPIISDINFGGKGTPPTISVEGTVIKPLGKALAKKWSALARDERSYANLGIIISSGSRGNAAWE